MDRLRLRCLFPFFNGLRVGGGDGHANPSQSPGVSHLRRLVADTISSLTTRNQRTEKQSVCVAVSRRRSAAMGRVARKKATHFVSEWPLSGAEGSRTPDLCIANAALSQLSYRPGLSDRVIGEGTGGNLAKTRSAAKGSFKNLAASRRYSRI